MSEVKQEKSDSAQVLCVGTADTKLEELKFLANSVRSNLNLFSSNYLSKVQVTVVDVSVSPKEIDSCGDFNFVPRKDVLSCYSRSEKQSEIVLPDDRGKALAIMDKSFKSFLSQAHANGNVSGVIGLGGSGGTSLLSSAFKCLPIGVPKLIVSTVASGQTQTYIGTSDLVLFPSVVDICGINSVSKVILSNAAAAFAGMLIGASARSKNLCSESSDSKKFTVGITMFGVTTPCASAVKDRLEKEGYETLVFHATGVGGRAMENLIREGFIQLSDDWCCTTSAENIQGQRSLAKDNSVMANQILY